MSIPLPVMETTDEQERWIEALSDAFDNPGSHPLEVAERALRACPGDPIVLSLASVAALLEKRPDRCLVVVKRLSKRYGPNESDHLLRALALAQQERFTGAATLLERHGLDNFRRALRFLPGGPPLAWWLRAWLERIRAQARASSARSRRSAPKAAAKSGRRSSAAKGRPAKGAGAPPPSSASPAPLPAKAPPELPPDLPPPIPPPHPPPAPPPAG